MLLDPGEKFVPEEQENLPCCLSLFSNRKIINALNKEIPDFNFIKGRIKKSIGAANKIRPAKSNIIPKNIERITINNLIFFEIFCVFALANDNKAKIKIIKIIIPKKIKFI